MLEFKNHKFRIMLVGDPHENDDLDSKTARAKAGDYLRFQYAAIDREKPDLVVLMGDNAGGETYEGFKATLDRIMLPYTDSCTPVAAVYGNHELEHGFSDRKLIDEAYKAVPGSLFMSGEYTDEYGDYCLPVCSDGKVSFCLYFMYSGANGEDMSFTRYDFVHDEQIAWYEKTSAEFTANNGGVPVPSIVIQHIPVPEEYRLLKTVPKARRAFDGVAGATLNKEFTYVLDRKTGVTGYLGEAPCSPDFNNSQFASWKKMGDVVAAFFGHDHMNDFVGTVDGIVLGQVKTSSFRAYGDGLREGVRMVELLDGYNGVYNTYMLRYRDIFGTKCDSIKGMELLPDRFTKIFE